MSSTNEIEIDHFIEQHAEADHVITTKSDMELVTQAWINERFVPELLPYATDPVHNLMELISFQEDELIETNQDLVHIIKSMEVERVKFVLRRYLSTRATKIQRHAMYYAHPLTQTYTSSVLSMAEHQFLTDFAHMKQQCLYTTTLKHLPEMFQSFGTHPDDAQILPNTVDRPALKTAVFVRVTRTIGDYELPDVDEMIDMQKGDLYLVQYCDVRNLVMNGNVEMI